MYCSPCAGPLGRHALGGRNWEGFSPDPYLTGIAMKGTVEGIQSTGVQATSKHFIGNEQELMRTSLTTENGTTVEAYSANIDDRTLHELYLWPFAEAVKAGSASVMCAYNRVNMTYACEDSHILKDILKGELGFKGYVMSDFFATHSGARSARNGLDMNMPGAIDTAAQVTGESFWGPNLIDAVNNGSVSSERLDDMAERIMTPYFALGQDQDFPTVDPSLVTVLAAQYGVSLGYEVVARDVRGDHAKLIRQISADGTVLLKNLNSTLPLKNFKNIGIFGNDAPGPTSALVSSLDVKMLDGPEFRTFDIGGGSGTVRHTNIVSPYQAIRERSEAEGARVQYIFDNDIIAGNDFSSIYPVPEVCLVFLKTWASEGADREDLDLSWSSAAVVKNVASLCPSTVVITHSAGVNTLPFASNPNVSAILSANYPGEQTGNSIVDILFGDVNPSAKLPFTIPAGKSDCEIPIMNITGPSQYDSSAWQITFTEGQLIDYRCFDANNIKPLYEFGFGLSYTEFELLNELTVQATATGGVSELPDSTIETAPGGNPDLWTVLVSVSTSVMNTGEVAGANVAQLYLSMPANLKSDSQTAPTKVLRGFEKIYLEPGEAKSVKFNLTRKDFSSWDVVAQNWRIAAGDYSLQVGFSSRDLRQNATITLL